jgi:hypothetical protein
MVLGDMQKAFQGVVSNENLGIARETDGEGFVLFGSIWLVDCLKEMHYEKKLESAHLVYSIKSLRIV